MPFFFATPLGRFTATAALFAGLTLLPLPAHALSEIQNDATTAPSGAQAPIQRSPLPLPNALGDSPAPAAPDGGTETEEPEGGLSSPSATHPQSDPDEQPAEVIYDLSRLPEPVRRMHQLIYDACNSGDIERLRPLIGTGETQTQLSLGDVESDPIEFLKQLAGDDQGHEILAILEEVLDAGFVHLDAGTPDELYVWPYFFAVPLDSLTGPQRVELFRIVTAGDYEEMKSFGAYVFYRVGITPEGRWSFFVAGE
ncbi:hypothetical protein [Tianweitania sediminis]|uniref:Fibronectin attachment protein n=1 Tax=Tianweitania sediminis TaxID=1502156 RepID=A0A8J7R0P4_9HYPH|nr:hypothetical protein [Tianweitania sediminis]MBP0438962.1 hypothetical protein [Tianweitania sediminis]